MIRMSDPLLTAEREALEDTSELTGEGSCVCIARRAKNLPAQAPGTKYRLLLIDDDPEFARIMQRMLGLAGYEVRTATDRETGSRELRAATPPHLILLDVGLGNMDGFDVLARLRRHPRLGSIPVVMLTAHATRKDVARGLMRGADGYVSKPCRIFALNHAIRIVLGIP
jgi:two-component system, OmpR family, response regulator